MAVANVNGVRLVSTRSVAPGKSLWSSCTGLGGRTTTGTLSFRDWPSHFEFSVVAKVADVLPNASVVTFPGAGHIPHITHPDAYVEAILAFIRKNQT